MADSTPFARAALPPMALYQEAWSRVRPQYGLFLGVVLVGVIVGSIGPMGILMGPMMVGIYLCYRALAKGQEVRFDLLFKGFDRFLEAFIAALLIMAASLVIVVPLVFLIVFAGVLGAVGVAAAGHHGGEEVAGLLGCLVWAAAILLMMLASMLVGLFFTFTFPLIADRGLPGLEAVKLSFRAALANLGGLLVLALATFLLTLVGICFCYVGALLLLPLTFGVHWLAYERVFGLKEDEPAVLPAETA